MSAFRRRGLSLIEVLIVLVLITVLMALSLPMLSHANATARASVCRQNLNEIGSAVTGYIRDYGKLPEISELPPHKPGLSLPEAVKPRLQTPNSLYCPSDETKRSHLLGTSYQWSPTYNGLAVDEFQVALNNPLLIDREPFHVGTELASNELVLKRAEGVYQFAVTGSDETTKPTAVPRKKKDHPKGKQKHKQNGKDHPKKPDSDNKRGGDDDDDDQDDDD